MVKVSAALCCYRRRASGDYEVLLIHPGGPYFVNRDLGIWSFPKGEWEPGEEMFETALREFAEEVGATPPAGDAIPLGEIRQRNGKRVIAFAMAGSDDLDFVASNEFDLEWPPHSGIIGRYPEADRGGWYDTETARTMLVPAQSELLDRLLVELKSSDSNVGAEPTE